MKLSMNRFQQKQEVDCNLGQTQDAKTLAQIQARSQSTDEPTYPSGRHAQFASRLGYGFSGARQSPAIDPQRLAKGFTLVPISEDLQWLYDRSLVTPKVMTYSKQLIERVSRLEFGIRQVIRRCDHSVFTHKLGEMPLHCVVCLLQRSLQRDDLGAVVYTCQDVAIPVVAHGGLIGFGRLADEMMLSAIEE